MQNYKEEHRVVNHDDTSLNKSTYKKIDDIIMGYF